MGAYHQPAVMNYHELDSTCEASKQLHFQYLQSIVELIGQAYYGTTSAVYTRNIFLQRWKLLEERGIVTVIELLLRLCGSFHPNLTSASIEATAEESQARYKE